MQFDPRALDIQKKWNAYYNIPFDDREKSLQFKNHITELENKLHLDNYKALYNLRRDNPPLQTLLHSIHNQWSQYLCDEARQGSFHSGFDIIKVDTSKINDISSSSLFVYYNITPNDPTENLTFMQTQAVKHAREEYSKLHIHNRVKYKTKRYTTSCGGYYITYIIVY